MGEVSRDELAAMTDLELLAYEREHHGDPYMSLLKAKGMQRIALQLWHVGATRKKADREALLSQTRRGGAGTRQDREPAEIFCGQRRAAREP